MRYRELITEATEQKLKHGSTRGHLGEFLLGGAIAAKFIKGADPIDTGDVIRVLKGAGATANLSAEFKTANEQDTVEFTNVITNVKNIADAQDVDSLVSVMAEELAGSVKFANTFSEIKKLSRDYAQNSNIEKVVVKAAGEEDQKGTKADIFLYLRQPDGSLKIIRPISVKTGSNLVGQGSPRTFDGIQAMFADLGIQLTPIDNYDENTDQHVKSIMQQVVRDLNAYTQGESDTNEQRLVQQLGNFLNKHVGLNDDKLVVVNIGKGDYTTQKINTMIRNLPNIDLESSFKQGGRPAVLVHERGNPSNQLFQVRYTYQAPRVNSKGKRMPERHRMFVEVGPLFKQLATFNLKRDDNVGNN